MSSPDNPAFVEVPPELLASFATDSDRIPTLYFSRFRAVRFFFWMRLRHILALMGRFSQDRSSCLDFGGGGGVFHPTLSRTFQSVTCVDLENSEALRIREHYGLRNVELVRGDVRTVQLAGAPFPNIVAADVLEHFDDLSAPVSAIHGWLSPAGLLYTSLPTETRFYAFLRKVFGIQKPADHYFSAREVEAYLASHGFARIASRSVPPGLPGLALFTITAWQRSA